MVPVSIVRSVAVLVNMMCAKEQDVVLIATMANVLDVREVVIILVLPAQVLAIVGCVGAQEHI